LSASILDSGRSQVTEAFLGFIRESGIFRHRGLAANRLRKKRKSKLLRQTCLKTNTNLKPNVMKRLMLILTAMAAGLSFSQGQVKDYTLAWAETPFLAAPENATVVTTGSDNAIYTITDRYDEVYNYDVTCYVYGQTVSTVTATYNKDAYSHDISGNTGIKGIALPFDFYYNGKTMKYVLPMAVSPCRNRKTCRTWPSLM